MLTKLLAAYGLKPRFMMIEIGARPVTGPAEPFHALLKAFPGSRNIAFEVDEELCQTLNRNAASGMEFYPKALGKAVESKIFYATEHPMCASLYEPDERWPDLFHYLDVMRTKHTGTLDVTTLAAFAKDKGINAIDFVKLDVQGAELEVLQGAEETLDSVVCIVCEVEFVHLYKNQPLFGDVDAFLRSRGFLLHKFQGAGGRAMKPIVFNNDPNHPSQLMWSDAVFVRDLRKPERMTDEQLLKLAVYMEMYGSVDVCHYLMAQLDSRRGTRLADEMLKQLIGVNA